ncbi:hypothetical protein ANN_18745 [Periplaneta americana]|uniref:Uncharacterized protein n=1 Tax=Periplaneta americana TaxID=6978 RepID=A0ABQ8SQ42_PERAM|nr:hypothetical protein ANN_18745 [Periplaneta americana]
MAGLCKGGNEPPGSLKASQELNFLPSEEAQGEASRVWFGSFDSSISDMRERMNCIIKYCKEKAIRDSSVWTTIAQELAKQRPSDERQREFEDDDEVDIKSIDDSKFSERNDANSTKKSYPVCTSSSPQNKLFSALQKQNESPERKFISITSTDIPISGATSNQNQTINITSNEDDITASKDSVIQNKVATDSTPAALNQNSTLSVDSTKQQNSIEKITQEATIPIDSVEQNKTTTTDKQSTKLSKSNMKQEEVTADIMTEIRNTRPIESSPENVKEQNENKCIITEGTSLFSDIRKQNKNTVILVKQNETTTTVTNQSCMPGPTESFSNSAHEITREITNSLEPIVVSEDMTKDSSEITSDSEKRNKSTDREQSTRIIHNFERTDASNSEGQEIPFSTNVLRTNNVQISEDEIPMSVLESRFDISVIDNNTMKNLELSLESVLRQQVGNVASSLAPHVIDIIKEDLRRYMVQDLMAKALSSVIETSLDPNCEGPSEEIKKIIVHEWKKEMVHVIQKQKAERENEFKSVLTRAKEYQERMKAICNVAAQNGKCTSKEKVIDYVGDGGDDDVSSSQGNCNDYFHPVTCHSEENQSNNMLTDIVQDFMQFQNDRRQNLTNICIDKEVQTVSTGKVLYLKCLNDV